MAIESVPWLRVMVSAVLVLAVVERRRELATATTADSWIVQVLVLAMMERWWELATPTMAGSSVAEVLVPVERKRGLVARTLGPVLHPHTNTGHTYTDTEHTPDTRHTLDTGHSNTVTHRSTDTVGNSRE